MATIEDYVSGATPNSVPSLADSSVDTHDVTKALFGTPPRGEKTNLNEFLSPDSEPGYRRDSRVLGSLDLAINSAEFKRRTSAHVDCSSSFARVDNRSPLPWGNGRRAFRTLQERRDVLVPVSQGSTFCGSRSHVQSPPKVPLDADETFNDVLPYTTETTHQQPRRPANSGWQAIAESLERECLALKEIVKLGRRNVLTRQGRIMRTHDSRNQDLEEISLLHAELDSTHCQLNPAEIDTDVKADREAAYVETIEILKHEIERLVDENAAPESRREIRRLHFEKDLFAAQIVQHRREISTLSAMLALREDEVERLKMQLNYSKIESSLSEFILTEHSGTYERAFKLTLDPRLKQSSDRSTAELKSMVEHLAFKVGETELERQRVSRCHQIQLNKNENTILAMKKMIANNVEITR
jgi:hypothetical protein